MRHSHDIVIASGGGDVSSLQDERDGKNSAAHAERYWRGNAESTRHVEQTREAHEQIAPIIDAMESRAARVEQLVEEMELLLVDIQSLLDTIAHQSLSSRGSPI